MSTSTPTTTSPRPFTLHSRTNSTRSRKHSAPVRIHALLRTRTDSGSALKHNGHGHRCGASLSASATVSPTPIDSVTTVRSPRIDGESTISVNVLNARNTHTHTSSTSSPTPASSFSSRGRQRSHSYASAPLSTLLTHLDSSSLASFTPADIYPCASGSLKKCQLSLLKASAYGSWYGSHGEDNGGEATSYVEFPTETPKSPRHTLPNVASPLSTKGKLRRVLPSRLLQKKAPPPSATDDTNKRSGSDSESNTDRESSSDGASDTPSLSPRSSRPSSRSRSSISTSPSSSSHLPHVPLITRQHSGLGELVRDKLSPLASSASEAMPAVSPVAMRTESNTETSPGSMEVKQDPGTASEKKYKTGGTLTIQTQDVQIMSSERIPSSLSPPPRTLRSSRDRQSVRLSIPSALPNEAAIRVPFPVPTSNPPSSHPTSLSPTSPDKKRLLSLSDLEHTSKLMRSTTTCAVCGRSGSDFPRCPRTGATWCSRACRITAKNKLKGTTTNGGDAS